MVRFRVGQNWMYEGEGRPVDFFSLEIGGFNLLPQVTEEPLGEVIPNLIRAVHGVTLQNDAWGHLSLPESGLELCFSARGTEVELSVVDMGRPAKLAQKPLRLSGRDWAKAVHRCGVQFLADLALHAPSSAATLPVRKLKPLLKQLATFEGNVSGDEPTKGWSFRQRPEAWPDLGFELFDPNEILKRQIRGPNVSLPSLLTEGALFLREEADVLHRIEGCPFLLVLEVSRQAEECAKHLELGEPTWSARVAGVGPMLHVHFKTSRLEFTQVETFMDPREWIQKMAQLPLSYCQAIEKEFPWQKNNPFLLNLSTRSEDVLSRIRPGAPAMELRSGEAQSPPRWVSQPLRTRGHLRKIKFHLEWQTRFLGDTSSLFLRPRSRGVLLANSRKLMIYSPTGKLERQYDAEHGIAFSENGDIFCVGPQRLEFHSPDSTWTKEMEGGAFSQKLWRIENRIIARNHDNTVFAFDVQSGMEVWKLSLPGTKPPHVAMAGTDLALASQRGHLWILDAVSGRQRFGETVRLPFAAPPQFFKNSWFTLSNQGSHVEIHRFEAFTGHQQAHIEQFLATPSKLLLHAGRLWVAGTAENRTWLICYDLSGRLLWKKELPLTAPHLVILGSKTKMIVTDGTGSSFCMDTEGRPLWLSSEGTPSQASSLSPILMRNVLFLPGACLRALDAESGRVLSSIELDHQIQDLKVDARLNVYTLNETGLLQAFRRKTHLSIV